MLKRYRKLTKRLSSRVAKKKSVKQILIGVLAILVVALIIGEIANDAVNSSQPYTKIAEKNYLAATVPILLDSNVLGQEITEWRSSNLAHISLSFLDAELANWEKSSQDDIVDLNTVGIPPLNAEIEAKLNAALALRKEAIQTIQQGFTVDTASAGPLPAHAASDLVEAGKQIRSSNRLLLEVSTYVKKKHLDNRYNVFPLSAWDAPLDKWDAQPVRNWLATWSQPLYENHLGSGLVISDISTTPLAVKILGIPSTTLAASTTTTTLAASTTTTTLAASTTTTTLAASTTTTTSGSATSTTLKGRANSGKRLHHKVTTTTLFVPLPISQIPPSASTSVLPPVSSLVVKVVVTDQSAEEAYKPVLELNIVGQSPGKSRKSLPKSLNVSKEIHLAPIKPSGSRYITWQFHHLHLGGSYKLNVQLSDNGFKSTSDQIKFQVAAS